MNLSGTQMDDEVWVPVPGFDGYEVSSHGKIKTCKFGRNYTLKQIIACKGYMCVSLYNKEGKHLKKVHRVVAESFIENNDPQKNCINHKDGNKFNNHVSNLEWCTNSENMIHAHRNKLINYAVGEKSNSKLTSDQVLEIRKLRSDGYTHQAIADMYGIGSSSVSLISNRKIWKHI
jgi:hypothetical protein